ncbi:MAG: tRNA pseudouridine(38-40) synthase TruA [Pirellulaceae bacterium]|nr:tRNA pseudouridine(38-40) synthase TruA [Pirellulaceae bacterium]
MRFFKGTLAYDGSYYNGWQFQPNVPTVQGHLETALTKLCPTPVRVAASSRTDSGVHALGQVISFSLPDEVPYSCKVIQNSLNANTPRTIVLHHLEECPENFHSIRDNRSKRYRYIVLDTPLSEPFLRGYVWHFPRKLDVEAMAQGAQYLLGEHDFSSFETAGAPRKSSVRNLFDISVKREPMLNAAFSDPIAFEVEANGFLYHMVRNIVGTLIAVGTGRKEPQWIQEVLAAKNRVAGGQGAPAYGLYLLRIRY